MGTLEDPKSILVDRLLQNYEGENGVLYTGDGSVDINGNPVLKHKTGNWKACYFILGTECCERLAFFSISTNLVTFLTAKLRQGNVSAAKNATVWQGTCYLTPLIGAALADAGLGRYWTIVGFCALYVLGMCGLTLSATVRALGPEECIGGSFCPPTTSAQYWFFMFALYLVALGTGGIKPCVSPFGADQFDDTDPKERAKKGSFFNYFYFSIYIGIIFASTVMVWVQENVGWGFGFGVPALAMAFAVAGFVSGTSLYRFRKPEGSPFTRISQVLVASCRKWSIEVPEDSSLLYESRDMSCKLGHTPSLKFLDKAAVISDSRTSNPWNLCSVTQVEEVKTLLRLFPIWATGIVYGAVYAQVSTLFVEQGTVMDTRIGSFSIPPASVSTCDAIGVLVFLPIYDALLVPLARRFTGEEKGFSELQRMGIGLAVSTLPVVCAALLETARLGRAATELSVLWQVPQYFLMGISEVFAYVAQIEFFYEQSPDSTRSLCTAMMLSTLALGYYLNSFILTVVTRLSTRGGRAGWIPDNLDEGHLDRFFWLLAALSLVNFFVYVVCAKRFKPKKASY